MVAVAGAEKQRTQAYTMSQPIEKVELHRLKILNSLRYRDDRSRSENYNVRIKQIYGEPGHFENW